MLQSVALFVAARRDGELLRVAQAAGLVPCSVVEWARWLRKTTKVLPGPVPVTNDVKLVEEGLGKLYSRLRIGERATSAALRLAECCWPFGSVGCPWGWWSFADRDP